jgi:hypothetical protein
MPSATPPVNGQPWLKDEIPDLSVPGEDAFAVDPIVNRLVDLVQRAQPPFVLSLSGAWGVGKSTIADNLQHRFEAAGGLVAYVDAWTTDLDNLRRTLAIEAGAALRGKKDDQRGPDREAIADLLDTAIREDLTATETKLEQVPIKQSLSTLLHSPLLILFGFVGLLLLYIVLNTDPTSSEGRLNAAIGTIAGTLITLAIVGSGIFVRTTTNATRRAAAKESVVYSEVFANIITGREAALANEQGVVGKALGDAVDWIKKLAGHPKSAVGSPALVIVDNLDRLSSDDALTALASIRAFVEIKGSRCLFLIPVDRRALARHLAGALASGSDEIGTAGDYLGKFFNLDLVLTDPEPVDMRDWAFGQIARALPDLGEDDRASIAQVVASAANGSPRQVRRIINGISTRIRLIDPSLASQVSATQVAFVEGLLVAFPDLLPGLVNEPRDFIDKRATLPIEGDDNLDLGRLLTPRPDVTREPAITSALASYLRRNVSIDLDASALRAALSLRPNRHWKNVLNPEPFVTAMNAGQLEAFEAALVALDPDERAAAIRSAVGVLETDLPRYPRDAVTHLNAIAASAKSEPMAAARIRGMATLDATVLRATDSEFSGLRLESVDLLASLFPAPRLGTLAGRLAGQLEDARAASADVRLPLRRLCLVSDRLVGDDLASARRTVTGLDDIAAEPVFEPEIVWPLAKEDLLNAYLGRLATWTAAAADQEPAKVAARRLIRCRDAGWTGPEQFRIIAGVAASNVAAGMDPDPLEVLLTIARLAADASEGPEIDALATSIMSTPPPDAVPFLRAALKLPVGTAGATALENGLDSWLATCSIDDARLLLIDGSEDVDAAELSGSDAVVERWISGAGPDWAALATEIDGGDTADLLAGAAESVTDDSMFGRLASEATSVSSARSDIAAGQALVRVIAQRVPTLAIGILAGIGPTLVTLRSSGCLIADVTSAVEARAIADPDFATYIGAVHALDTSGVVGLRGAVRRLAERGAASGGVPIGEIEWMVRVTNGTDEARRVTTRAIESEAVDQVAGLIRSLPALRRHQEVRLATAIRAQGAASPDEARALLDAARDYQRPTDPRYQVAIDDLGQRWPAELTDFLNELH